MVQTTQIENTQEEIKLLAGKIIAKIFGAINHVVMAVKVSGLDNTPQQLVKEYLQTILKLTEKLGGM
jgi:rRNA processing protein Gar1